MTPVNDEQVRENLYLQMHNQRSNRNRRQCTTPSNTWFLGSTRVFSPNEISIGSAVFARLTMVANRQTPTTLLRDFCSNSLHLALSVLAN